MKPEQARLPNQSNHNTRGHRDWERQQATRHKQTAKQWEYSSTHGGVEESVSQQRVRRGQRRSRDIQRFTEQRDSFTVPTALVQ